MYGIDYSQRTGSVKRTVRTEGNRKPRTALGSEGAKIHAAF
jgi:hypothetical protein